VSYIRSVPLPDGRKANEGALASRNVLVATGERIVILTSMNIGPWNKPTKRSGRSVVNELPHLAGK
jgi:hypothetical protein